MARQVADALRIRILSPEREHIEKKPTQSMAAYTLYLKGRDLYNKARGVEDAKRAIECFEQASKEDSNFALAYVGLADSNLWLRNFLGTELEERMEKVETILARAIELDPDLAEAHATRGWILMDEYKPRQAEEEFRKAIQLNPSYARAHSRYSDLLMGQLRWDEALEQGEKAMELNPLSPDMIANVIHVCYHRRDFGKAFELAKRAFALDPDNPDVHFLMILVYGQMGRHEDVVREGAIYADLVKGMLPQAQLAAEMLMAVAEGDTETIRRRMPAAEAHFLEMGFSAYMIASGCFYIGDNDKGFEWLRRSYDTREANIMEIKNDQNLDGVRTDPRYLDLLKKLGLD